jgi:preprotein translocase subunit SecF
VTAGEQPGDAQQLREEIERTREHLGETVEQLAAKADVKVRAQTKAAELGRQVTWQARSVTAQAQRLGGQARKQAAVGAGAARKQAAVGAGAARKQAAVGAGAARKHRVPLSAAVGAGLVAAIVFIIWQRSTR